jgi:integrase/recombinase XerD
MTSNNRKPERQFWQYVRSYLTIYLPRIRCLSPKTSESYRQSIAAYCTFLKETCHTEFSAISFSHFDRTTVVEFLQWLRRRNCRSTTCNLRLSAIKSFLKYCADEDLRLYSVYLEIKSIPMMKVPKATIQYLSESAMKAVLAQASGNTSKAARNGMLLIMLYDTGCRVQELVDLKVGDLHLAVGDPFVIVTGKGNKPRRIPLMDKTVSHLRKYIDRFHPNEASVNSSPLFYSIHRGKPHSLSTDAVSVILKTCGERAAKTCPDVPDRVNPHLIRHTRAMHLYRAGMPLSYVAEFLGHASITTTEIYATASTDMLRNALETADPDIAGAVPSWKNEETLRRLCGL